MNSNIDILIDHNLKKVADSGDKGFLDANFSDRDGKSIQNYQLVSQVMVLNGLIYKNINTCYLSDDGKKIIEAHGWLKHLNIVEELKDIEKTKKEKEYEFLQLNIYHLKSLIKRRNWPYIISGLSLIVSIIALIFSLTRP